MSDELKTHSFDDFPISEATREKLVKKGITCLFPIQGACFNHVYEGEDVIGLARTGTGKTLAFSLPIIERLKEFEGVNYTKDPLVLILAPTRELVSQISNEISSITELKVLTLYGGVSYEPQIRSLRSGVNIVVGTPGRILDMLAKEILKLESVNHVILDEVDRMLDMGFSKDVESILCSLYDKKESKPQTLLFSATIPEWVKGIAEKYLNANHKLISCIDPNGTKASNDVSHFCMVCPYAERASTISDVIKVYAPGKDSRTIVFCVTKKNADELASSASMAADCHVMHGDIPQEKREMVLEAFRSGKYKVLITTNVVARGIDVPNVDLVIQCQPPNEIEDYIHRSGRTGRAGRKGVSICLYTPKDEHLLREIEKAASVQFQRISPPTTEEIVLSSGDELAKSFVKIPEQTWKAFLPSAENIITMLNHEDQEAKKTVIIKRALCCALATIAGKSGELESRSLINSKQGFVTFQLDFLKKPPFNKGGCYKALRTNIADEVVEALRSVLFLKDKSGFVFDLPSGLVEQFETNWRDTDTYRLTKLSSLPEIETMEDIERNKMEQNNNKFGNNNNSRPRNGYQANSGNAKFGGRKQWNRPTNGLSFGNNNGSNGNNRNPKFGNGGGQKRPFGNNSNSNFGAKKHKNVKLA